MTYVTSFVNKNILREITLEQTVKITNDNLDHGLAICPARAFYNKLSPPPSHILGYKKVLKKN